MNVLCSLALAEQLGADVCLNPQASATPAEVGEWLKASLPPYGPDIVIDCAGFQSTLQVEHLPFPPCIAGAQVFICQHLYSKGHYNLCTADTSPFFCLRNGRKLCV